MSFSVFFPVNDHVLCIKNKIDHCCGHLTIMLNYKHYGIRYLKSMTQMLNDKTVLVN